MATPRVRSNRPRMLALASVGMASAAFGAALVAVAHEPGTDTSWQTTPASPAERAKKIVPGTRTLQADPAAASAKVTPRPSPKTRTRSS
jgi:hypothetical protein